MLIALLLALAMQDDPSDEPPSGPDASGAAWVAQPTHEQFERVYPKRADWGGLAGRVVLHCIFTAAGRLSDCTVVSETPAGQRFGAAALKLTPYFRAVAKPAGASLEGKPITLPIAFRIHGRDGEPATDIR